MTDKGEYSTIRVFPIGNIPFREFLYRIAIPNQERAVVMQNAVEKSPRTIGRFIRERRQASHLTQQQLGELAGVGTRFVSDLERGKPTLRMDAVNRVLNVFGQMLGRVEAPRDESE